jgi:glucose/arabinose dehydrogenase
MHSTPTRWIAVAALALTACPGPGLTLLDDGDDFDGGPPCADDDGEISLLPGFCAAVVADNVGAARHLTVTPSGDVYIALLDTETEPGGLLALRDGNDDGRADEIHRVYDGAEGSGVAWKDGQLYFGQADRILRFRAPDGELLGEQADFEVVVSGLPDDGDHYHKSVALDDSGNLYVNIGSASNACQVENRVPGSPGVDPCPELEERAGLWRFYAAGTGQTPADGYRYATGIRNGNALAVHPDTGEVVVVQNGRDQLDDNWPDLFSLFEERYLPAEELFVVQEGGDYGWPYCYFDPTVGKVLAPEYGGDGEQIGRCATTLDPDAAFPAHWAPLSIAFVEGSQFPESMRGGALIAFHGSWHGVDQVGPLPGYQVGWIDWTGSGPSSELVPLAWDFVKEDQLPLPEAAEHRPMGLAQAPDGSFYVSDDVGGRIYRIWWAGDRLDL